MTLSIAETEADIAAYVTMVIEEGDASELAYALGVVAKARGIGGIAQAAGLASEALYKALRPGAQPRFDTISRVCSAIWYTFGSSTLFMCRNF